MVSNFTFVLETIRENLARRLHNNWSFSLEDYKLYCLKDRNQTFNQKIYPAFVYISILKMGMPLFSKQKISVGIKHICNNSKENNLILIQS